MTGTVWVTYGLAYSRGPGGYMFEGRFATEQAARRGAGPRGRVDRVGTWH